MATTISPTPDRTVHEAILTALTLPTQADKEEALRKALESWQDDGADGVLPPHLLVYLFNRKYDLAKLPNALSNKDLSDYAVLQKVCTELNYKVLLESVKKGA